MGLAHNEIMFDLIIMCLDFSKFLEKLVVEYPPRAHIKEQLAEDVLGVYFIMHL